MAITSRRAASEQVDYPATALAARRARVRAFRGYVKDRYGTADRAAAFWRSHHWY